MLEVVTMLKSMLLIAVVYKHYYQMITKDLERIDFRNVESYNYASFHFPFSIEQSFLEEFPQILFCAYVIVWHVLGYALYL